MVQCNLLCCGCDHGPPSARACQANIHLGECAHARFESACYRNFHTRDAMPFMELKLGLSATSHRV